MTGSETLEAASGVIEVKGEYQIAPETAYLCLYYSPKKRKFIKGRFLDDLRTRHHHHGVVLKQSRDSRKAPAAAGSGRRPVRGSNQEIVERTPFP